MAASCWNSSMLLAVHIEMNVLARTIAVVGNGPTKGVYGDRMDGCDLVLRMNRCRIHGFESHIGSRTDVYATYPRECLTNWQRSDVSQSRNLTLDFWLVRPEGWCNQQ